MKHSIRFTQWVGTVGILLSVWGCQSASSDRTLEESLQIGNAKMARGDYKGAEDEFNLALQKAPNNPNFLVQRGLAQAEQGKLILALQDYTQALTTQPDLFEALVHRGNAHNQLLQLEDALLDFSQAIAIQPDHAVAYSNRAVTYFNLGQVKQAIADLEKAKSIYQETKAIGQLTQVEQLLAEYRKSQG